MTNHTFESVAAEIALDYLSQGADPDAGLTLSKADIDYAVERLGDLGGYGSQARMQLCAAVIRAMREAE